MYPFTEVLHARVLRLNSPWNTQHMPTSDGLQELPQEVLQEMWDRLQGSICFVGANVGVSTDLLVAGLLVVDSTVQCLKKRRRGHSLSVVEVSYQESMFCLFRLLFLLSWAVRLTDHNSSELRQHLVLL